MILTQFPNGYQAEIDNPQISQTSGNHQDAQSVWIGQMTFIKKRPTPFRSGEESLDLKALSAPLNGLIRQFEISN
jgi:hypothetical protein